MGVEAIDEEDKYRGLVLKMRFKMKKWIEKQGCRVKSTRKVNRDKKAKNGETGCTG